MSEATFEEVGSWVLYAISMCSGLLVWSGVKHVTSGSTGVGVRLLAIGVCAFGGAAWMAKSQPDADSCGGDA